MSVRPDSRLAVIVAGAWGTALSVALGSRHEIILWARDAGLVREMRTTRENRRFLPGIPLPASVRVESELASAVCGAGFAEEIARSLPAALTLASRDGEFARRAAAQLHGGRLRIYANDDLVGAEIAGAVKNVMAIAAGICDGLQFGHNARAALMTRGLAEITRLGVALGGKPATFIGLVGMGDLILTCTGNLSRNRRVGLALAAGKPLPEILAELGHVAESVGTAREVAALSRSLAIDMPITQAVDTVLHHSESPLDAVEKLLGRDLKVESL